MNSRRLLPVFLLSLASSIPCAAFAAGPPDDGAQLHQLDVSAGHWVYHGRMLGAHPSAWTWNEDCNWSGNHVFMLCSFSNTWGGRHVDSVVVDTYNRHDDSFWHYEIFSNGAEAAKPFASKMQIDGATRSETWSEARHGKSMQQRIVYKFASDSKVTVVFQQSSDGSNWKTTASGTGEKTAG